MLLSALLFFCSISFIWYGFKCLYSEKMFNEFQRFGLSKYRKLTGTLQLIGGIGLMLSFIYPLLTLFSSAGMALLMLLGVLVRIKIKDGILLSIPAFVLMLLNLYILFASYDNYEMPLKLLFNMSV